MIFGFFYVKIWMNGGIAMKIITISREFGSGGRSIAKAVAD